VDDDEDTQQKFPRRRVAFEDTQQTALDEEDDEDEEPINLEDKKGKADHISYYNVVTPLLRTSARVDCSRRSSP
jgi:hypothetical protein